jgi:type VI secretion system protein ImpM
MTTTIDEAALAKAAGWHGKLPTLGDFATRRLPPDFVAAWDAWLSDGLAALQQRDPDWLDAYLMSPSWRFLLMPGVLPGGLGETPWVGVLMPSVDRVGRYYPLTLAQPLAALPSDKAGSEALWVWLLRLEEAAADAMHDDWSIDALEAELVRLGAVPRAGAAHGLPSLDAFVGAEVAELSMAGLRHPPALFAARAHAEWARGAQGDAYWYAQPDMQSPRLLCSRGLTRSNLIARLLGGQA